MIITKQRQSDSISWKNPVIYPAIAWILNYRAIFDKKEG